MIRTAPLCAALFLAFGTAWIAGLMTQDHDLRVLPAESSAPLPIQTIHALTMRRAYSNRGN